jgi:GNAT superfamily N-acetyltransferase
LKSSLQITLAKTDEEILDCFNTLHVLRPHLEKDTFLNRIRHQQSEGFHLAYLQNQQILAVAGFRMFDSLVSGKTLYIDDLVSLPEMHGKGYGGQLLKWLLAYAKKAGCVMATLDSGHHRFAAHRFYLNNCFKIRYHQIKLSK